MNFDRAEFFERAAENALVALVFVLPLSFFHIGAHPELVKDAVFIAGAAVVIAALKARGLVLGRTEIPANRAVPGRSPMASTSNSRRTSLDAAAISPA